MLAEMTTDPEKIKAKIEGQEAETPEETEAKITGNPLFQREYTFPFAFTTRDGRRFAGTFKNAIVDLGTRVKIGTTRAQMLLGLPVNSIDEETTAINAMIAHMTWSLTERPDWAKHLDKLDDLPLLEALWEEVQKHEGTFHGPRKAAAAGSGAGKDDGGTPAGMVDRAGA